ncbi:MAG: CHAT domain-containing protein [Deltaproteobacteria bacterium]|nr:CHAT domain-containing protein [Deltaproteobacteria bacterium]MBI2348630.1 CHAT domain-containing protein [Deltaproteobacteria bacterium]
MGEKAREPELQVKAILQLSQALGRLGQHAKRREWLQKGIGIAKLISPGPSKENVEANLHKELGADFLRTKETQQAVDYLSYSLQVQESRLARVKGRRRAALQRIQNAEFQVVGALERLGHAYQDAGKSTEAIKAYERGLGIIRESGLKTHFESSLYQRLGRLYLGQKDYARAEENLKRALGMAEKLQHAQVIQRASGQIGDLLRQTQRPSEAISYYKKAVDIIESTRSLLESEELRTSFFEDKGQIYGGMILAHLEAGNVEEAFNYSERARSRAFLDILGSKVQLARGTLLEHERALQARISILRAMIVEREADAAEEAGAPEAIGASRRGEEARRELEDAQQAYSDFLARVRKEDKEQASLMSVEPLTLKEAQQLLEPGVTMLEYFVVRGRAMLWVVEKDRANFVRLSLNRSELVSKVTALRESIYQMDEKGKFKQTSEELYRALITPALPHIRGKELLIVPHDVLHYLPYHALLSGQGKYLIQDYPIYYQSSASLMQFTREKRKASGNDRVLVMGNPTLGDEAYNLRFAEREAKEVARVYPGSAVYLRAEATKPRAVSMSSKYDILHFAVHGELNQEDPLSSGLLLAGEGATDGKLKASEIFSLNLEADTVVLSACETGLGKITNGDEIIGLTRAFIYAGTPSVVTTLWKVNDRASYELMKEFYSNLKRAKKSEALRQAQLKIMKSYPHPFFWAAYELNGER